MSPFPAGEMNPDAMLRRIRIRAIRALVRSVAKMRRARGEMMGVLFGEYFQRSATIRVELEDHVLHLNPADQTITPRVLTEGHWHRPALQRALTVLAEAGELSSGKTFVDVGANIGTQSLYAMLSGRFQRAIAFEPEPRNAQLLRRNVTENDLGSRIEVVELALGAGPGTATMSLHRTNFGAHSIHAGRVNDTQGEVRVEVRTLDAALADLGVSPSDVGLIWLDVEGGEAAVVSGMPRLLAAGTPIVFEHIFRGPPPREALELVGIFARHFRHVYRLQDQDLRVRPVESVDPVRERGDFLVFGSRSPR